MTTNHATVAWHEGMGALAIKSVALAVRSIGPNSKQVVFARDTGSCFWSSGESLHWKLGNVSNTAYRQRRICYDIRVLLSLSIHPFLAVQHSTFDIDIIS